MRLAAGPTRAATEGETMSARAAVVTTGALLAAFIAVTGSAGPSYAQSDWTEPFPPFKIAGNLYYVGSKGLANYLITTPQGHILINSDLEENVPLIRASVEKLGFKFTDVKILLISHAHWDHNGASDTIKKLTGAKYMVMDADVAVVESGGKADFQYGNVQANLYKPTKVDRVLHDGDEVTLGGSVLVAHLTPGHTKGCTTWTMKVQDAGKTYNAVIVGGPNVNDGYRLVNNPAYPQIASDYEKMFRVLRSLPCDIFLGAHGAYFDLETKYARLKEHALAAFVDPEGYKEFVDDRDQAFKAELAKQRAAPSSSSLRSRQIVADSVGGFSGKQGANSWSYGYWDQTADTDKRYTQTADYQLLPHFGGDPINQLSTRPELGTGTLLWTLEDGRYYTSLWPNGGHPHGTMELGAHVKVDHWAVRRWVSTIDGAVTISGQAAKVLATNWGGGIQTRIVVDGKTVWSATIDNHGTAYSVDATVRDGSLVDFLIGPGPADAYAVGVTEFTATIRRKTSVR